MERHIIPEYATRHAQFRSGNVHSGGYGTATTVVNQDEIIGTKKDIADLVLRGGPDHTTSASSTLNFGYEGGAPGLVRELRERHPLAVLIVTGRGTSEGWEEEVTSAGADCACPWPLAIDHLKRILHRQLARRLA